MNEIIAYIAIGLGGLVLGYFFNRTVRHNTFKRLEAKSQFEADELLKKTKIEAEAKKKQIIFQAQEKQLKENAKFNSLVAQKEKELAKTEIEWRRKFNELRSKEKNLKSKFRRNKDYLEQLETKEKSITQKETHYQKELNVIEEQRLSLLNKLEEVSSMNKEEAKEHLLDVLKRKVNDEAHSYYLEAIEEAKLSAERQSQKVVLNTIQRIGVEESIEKCVTVVHLKSNDIKGRIIGREGRNIRTLEEMTGVDLIIDDTPQAVAISCFDPVRREIARESLERLIEDGRIQPGRIEDVVKQVTKKIENRIVEFGKKAVIDLGIHGLHPELIRIVGRMRFRTSFSQNLLHHSKEVARLCGVMAAELGLNAKHAKRAGLLHDIGKVPENETEVSHAILGMQWAKKYGERPEICNAIGAHHDEIEMTSLIAPVVQVCDGISGARPGTRDQRIDNYINRLEDLEKLAESFEGVNKAYPFHAGREVRVYVESSKVDDQEIENLSAKISQKIQRDLTYPGHIKVTVIRETRSTSHAK